ncbi:MAG: HEAT repeat domain-containing protein, partial [Planctomycetes bacterium]|nr:HEAT repeat domain-containing protein [Planctomycetota bacterium]
TSAFKMDQVVFPRQRSSVPSDRFYEDFDLRFGPAQRDPDDARLHYVRMLPSSEQRIAKEIYSARVVPGPADATRAALIGRFLEKCVAAKAALRPLDHVLSVAGHGYHSESLEAWRAQVDTLQQVFPALDRPGGRIDTLHHQIGERMKERVLTALRHPELDFVLFHAHGDTDLQFLIGDVPAGTLDARVDAVKSVLRERLRSASKKGEAAAMTVKLELMQRYGLPLAWFDGVDDPAVLASDEAEDKNRDIHVDDASASRTRARVMILDECFNGRFVESPYVAGAYLFSASDAVAVVANSVNVLQDLWVHEFVGQLGHGISVGRWHRQRVQLESMLLGDPTARFSATPSAALAAAAARDVDVDSVRPALESADPVEREAAVARLGERGVLDDARLVDVATRDASHVVRLAALRQLATRRGGALDTALTAALDDPCELVRRFAVILTGERAVDGNANVVLALAADDPSERVMFNARDALHNFRKESIAAAFATLRAQWTENDLRKKRLDEIEPFVFRLVDSSIADVRDPAKKPRERLNAARSFRNARAREAVPALSEVLARSDESPELRATIAEALGWFTFSEERATIERELAARAADPDLPAPVRAEVERSLRRLGVGPNHPLTP